MGKVLILAILGLAAGWSYMPAEMAHASNTAGNVIEAIAHGTYDNLLDGGYEVNLVYNSNGTPRSQTFTIASERSQFAATEMLATGTGTCDPEQHAEPQYVCQVNITGKGKLNGQYGEYSAVVGSGGLDQGQVTVVIQQQGSEDPVVIGGTVSSKGGKCQRQRDIPA